LKLGRRVLSIILLIITTLGVIGGCSNTQNAHQNQIELPNGPPTQRTETEEEFISATKVKNTVNRPTLLDSVKIDINKDGQEESIELYTAAERDSKGEIAWDDGQRWLLTVVDGSNEYILFDDYVQLGDLNFFAYLSEQNAVHITTIQNCDADFLVNDYVFDSEKKRFKRNVVFRPPISHMVGFSRY